MGLKYIDNFKATIPLTTNQQPEQYSQANLDEVESRLEPRSLWCRERLVSQIHGQVVGGQVTLDYFKLNIASNR